MLRQWSNILQSATLTTESKQNHNDANLEYSPDGGVIASISSHTAKLWDALNLSQIWGFSGDRRFSIQPSFPQSGRRVVFFRGCEVFDINIENEDLRNIMTTQRTLQHNINYVTFNPHGNTCAAWSRFRVKILNAYTFEEKTTLPYHDCISMQYSPDGNYILLVLESKKVIAWDIIADEAVDEVELRLGIEHITQAEISKDCLMIRVGDEGSQSIVRLMSTRY
jgi:WD40 repeat protein